MSDQIYVLIFAPKPGQEWDNWAGWVFEHDGHKVNYRDTFLTSCENICQINSNWEHSQSQHQIHHND